MRFNECQIIGLSMNDKDINDYIDKLHFRTPNHLMGKLKERFPDVYDDKLLSIIDSRWHDKFVKLRITLRYSQRCPIVGFMI